MDETYEHERATGEGMPETVPAAKQFDLVAHIKRQWAFSQKAFGPATRNHGVIDHIRKELAEIEADPCDLREWVDVIILGIDGACRCLAGPHRFSDPENIANGIAEAIRLKLEINEGREWPDWRSAPDGKAIEHVRAAPEPSHADV